MDEQQKRRPSPEALDQLAAALEDHELMRKVIGYAHKRTRLLQQIAGLPDGHDEVEELVYGSIADTATGRRSWDPARVRLEAHLCQLIKDRTSKRLRRAGALPHVEVPDGDEASEGGRLSSPAEAEARLIDWQLVLAVRGELLRMAEERGDEEVQLLLFAYEEGLSGRTELAEHMGVSAAAVTNARKRLDRLLKDLPADLVGDVRNRLREGQ